MMTTTVRGWLIVVLRGLAVLVVVLVMGSMDVANDKLCHDHVLSLFLFPFRVQFHVLFLFLVLSLSLVPSRDLCPSLPRRRTMAAELSAASLMAVTQLQQCWQPQRWQQRQKQEQQGQQQLGKEGKETMAGA